MFIDNTQYQTDLGTVNHIRCILFTIFYNDSTIIESLKEFISRNIECLGIDFSPTDFAFTIKIKKTAMRKLNGFEHCPRYYYQTVSKIFSEFISAHEHKLMLGLKITHPDVDPYQMLQYIYNNQAIMANLCYVTCISDNILVIKL